MAELRTFFGLEIGAAARSQAAAWLDALRAGPAADDLRWVREESLHVTLRFLGTTESTAIPALALAVGERVRGSGPFELSLGALQRFPSRRPRVLALAVEPAAKVTALAAAVERGVVAAGWPSEARPFRPHLTLGRLRRGSGPEKLRSVTASVTDVADAWEVHEVVLFQSLLLPGGARYAPLERIPVHP